VHHYSVAVLKDLKGHNLIRKEDLERMESQSSGCCGWAGFSTLGGESFELLQRRGGCFARIMSLLIKEDKKRTVSSLPYVRDAKGATVVSSELISTANSGHT
jgi:hypothetical protein